VLSDRTVTASTVRLATAEPTVSSAWLAVASRQVDRDLLRWPADLFAFTDFILDRSEAYRLAVSPPLGRRWPPRTAASWQQAVDAAAQDWCEWVTDLAHDPPPSVAREWAVIADGLDTPLEAIGSGRRWRLVQALLTLHAVADEACAGLTAGTAGPGAGAQFRLQMRERLTRTGTLSRIDPSVLRVVPKYRTPRGGITARSISRYLSRTGPAVRYDVHRVEAPGRDSASTRLNIVLLPWPMQIRSSDFQPLAHSVDERDVEPFGFFRYQPHEPLDIALLDRLLASAAARVDRVDIAVFPESSVSEEDLPRLEAVLSRHGVPMVIAGIRAASARGSALGSNWVHLGTSADGRWLHHRQDKHHRWSLDRSQIEQYHLDDVLDPGVRWWEAIEIRQRSLEIIERDDAQTIASLVCEDLAQLDEVAQLLRAVGPTLLVALLLDGPQLSSRWTARYASVLTDDPGSAVLTLTSHGMVANAWRGDRPASSVVALWKDNSDRPVEIALEPGAQGILLGLDRRPAIRRAADGRAPRHDASDLRISEITQLRSVDGEDLGL
jgi:hypothetical protein